MTLKEDALYVGDCIDLLQQVPDGCVALVATDPPFNVGYTYDGSFDDDRPAGEYVSWSRKWMAEVYRVLHMHGTFWLAIGDMFVSELDMVAKSLGFHKRSHVLWHFTFGNNCPNKFTPSHTHLLYYTKNRRSFTFNADAIKVPSARELVYNDKRAKPGGRCPDDVWVLRPQWYVEGFQAGDDTWHIPRIAGTFKQRAGTPNQMPEHVLSRIIKTCSNPGDLVVDPFCGSGTTSSVAKKLGRKWLTFELSPQYAELARKRIDAAQPGEAMAGPVPQGS